MQPLPDTAGSTADVAPSPRRRDVLLVAVGSSGDVHPFAGLGAALAARGHRVSLVTAGYFRGLAERLGIECIDPLPDVDFAEMIRDPAIWHPLRGPGRILDLAVRPLVEPIYRTLAARASGDTVVVASSLAFGARIAQERLGLPLVTVHLSPVLFRSLVQGPRVPGLAVHRGPLWSRRLQWWLADLFADRAIRPWLEPVRSSLGLPPVRGVIRDWFHSPLRVLGMFPGWFAPPQPDWPARTTLVGFPLYSEEGATPPPDDVQEFLAAGPPPIVFTPGSANVFGHRFFAAAADACRRLGRRGLLLTRFAEQVPRDLPAGVRHVDFVPFRWLLPQAAAVVHHGGIGSLSQGLAAGIPQLLMPQGFDQFDNRDRAVRLGVARWLPERRFTGRAVAAELDRLCGDPLVAARCRDVADRLTPADGLATAVAAIESLA